MVKEFWWKSASHVVPLMRTKWPLLLRIPQQTPNAFQWAGQPPTAFSCWKISTPFLGPQNGSSIGLEIFAGHIHTYIHKSYLYSAYKFKRVTMRLWHSHIRVTNTQTDRQTDHATCNVCSNRPHLTHGMHMMWPNNKTQHLMRRVSVGYSREYYVIVYG